LPFSSNSESPEEEQAVARRMDRAIVGIRESIVLPSIATLMPTWRLVIYMKSGEDRSIFI
jgi:hypothetical protein